MRRSRSFAKLLVWFLIPTSCGVVLAIAVSWGLVLRGLSNERYVECLAVRDGEYTWASRCERVGESCWSVRRAAERPNAVPLPTWVAIPREVHEATSIAYGWPLPCLAKHDEMIDILIVDFPKSLDQRAWNSFAYTLAGVEYQFPTRPIWPALLVDSFVYGAMVAGSWLALNRLKRRRMNARGSCVRCGYDRKGLPTQSTPCPECGDSPN